ncbi:Conserved_hypothetical protein [Hexamita inflata]|uniref:Transmembrane protein n=1 Tax=Hexamita inflata TaxID=28002 RepID=A0ABP1GLH8_9EUKA
MQFIAIIQAVQTNIALLNNISDCYGPNSLIEYRRNLDQIIIYLDSKSNANCTNFPTGIDVNLTFSEINTANVAKAPKSFTIEGFNYTTTKQLVINNIPVLSALDLQFVLVEIYSYAEITQIQVFNVNEIVSSLTQCFYDNSTVQISSTALTMQLMATGLCKIQINDMNTLQVVVSNEILSFLVSAEPSLQNLKANYNQDVQFTITLAGDYTRLWNVQSMAARIYIGTSTSPIKFSFSQINYQSVANLYSIATLIQSNEKFSVLLAPNKPVFDPFMANAQAVGYNSIVFRLNFVDFAFTIQNTFTSYDLTTIMQVFSCDQGDAVFKAACEKQYAVIKQTQYPRVFLELLFYQSNTVMTVHKTLLTTYSTIFDKTNLKIDADSFNFLTYYSGHAFTTSQDFQITVKAKNATYSFPDITFTSSWSTDSIAFKYPCPSTNDTCKELANAFSNNKTAIIVQYSYLNGTTSVTEASPVNLVYENNYQNMQTVALVIGISCIVLSVIFTVYQMLKVKRSIQAIRKKKGN